jgi:hypothetical protein
VLAAKQNTRTSRTSGQQQQDWRFGRLPPVAELLSRSLSSWKKISRSIAQIDLSKLQQINLSNKFAVINPTNLIPR